MTTQIIFTVIAFNTLVLALPIAALVLWLKPQWWLSLWTLFVGVLTGLMDLRADEVRLTVLLLLAFGFFAGFTQPQHAWRRALLLGIWIPIFAFIAMAAGLTPLRPQQLFGSPTPGLAFGASVALIPAFLGTYGGVVAKHLALPTRQDGV